MPSVARSTSAGATPFAPTTMPAGPILVASDTSTESDAAFPLAQVIASRTGASVQVLSVLQPYAMPMFAMDAVAVPLEADNEMRAARETALRDQMHRTVSSDVSWPITVETGEPAREIADQARTLNARVIVVGRGRHTALERVLGGESVLRLLEVGDTPVLAVEQGLTHLPRRVVIGTDFSAFSAYAAQVALSMIAPDAHITIANVAPPFEETDPVLRHRAEEYRETADAGFAQLRELLTRDELRVDDVQLSGNASDALREFAHASQADLIVIATHGYGFVRRLVLGSVAAAVVRTAKCSVLCIPGSAHTIAAARAQRDGPAVTHTSPVDAMDVALRHFTTRNVGRRCAIEVDQLDLGAQVIAHDLPFIAATSEPGSQTVSLMLGASTLEGAHFTHVVESVTSLDVRADGEGRDVVLRLAYPTGQTLLSLQSHP